MPQSELDVIRDLLRRLSGKAIAEARHLFTLDLTRTEQIAGLLAILTRYGEATASLGADVFEASAVAIGLKPRVELAAALNAQRAGRRFDWALNRGEGLAQTELIVDELVKQPYRSTFQDSALKSGAGWQRVVRGATTCGWCSKLAGNPVYSTRQTAMGRGKKYHGNCDCTAVLVAR